LLVIYLFIYSIICLFISLTTAIEIWKGTSKTDKI